MSVPPVCANAVDAAQAMTRRAMSPRRRVGMLSMDGSGVAVPSVPELGTDVPERLSVITGQGAVGGSVHDNRSRSPRVRLTLPRPARLTTFRSMNIEITPKKTDGLERLIEVRVPVETVRDAEDQAARRYASNVRLPGFRPGKAPPAMVKKRFKDAIRQQVIETLIQEAFQEVMDREQLKVASQPHVHDLKFE